MPINNPSCNSFDGNVNLSRTSSPNSSVCSGIEFNNNALFVEKVSHQKDGNKYLIRDFMETRQNGTLDHELCAIDPYGVIEYELIACKNRFGGALFREVGKIGPQYERFLFDERCVGYRTLTSNIPLTNTWQEEHVTYFLGPAQEVVSLINGPCIPGEPDQEFVISSDVVNCGGKSPCSELKKLVCKFDTNLSTPSDPTCANTNITVPYTLFQNNFFCSVIESAFPRLVNAFCSTDYDAIKLKLKEVLFCETDYLSIAFAVNELVFCSIDANSLRAVIEEVTFCRTDTSFIRNDLEIVAVKYCSLDASNISYVSETATFCSISDIILELKFCSVPNAL